MARPLWVGPRGEAGRVAGRFEPELEREFLIFRPVMAGIVSMTEINQGTVDLMDLIKLNALLDAREASEASGKKPKGK
ncbi:hypothetical protein A7X93_00645 [Stenotrophomonas maltophilia]|nr:hypothetical protein A7X93_00645 [Stenotrophomonas maltophilia]